VNAYALIVEKLTQDFGVDAEAIHPGATLSELGIDSLSAVEFIFELEDELGVELDPEEAEFETLQEAADLLEQRVEEKGG